MKTKAELEVTPNLTAQEGMLYILYLNEEHRVGDHEALENMLRFCQETLGGENPDIQDFHRFN